MSENRKRCLEKLKQDTECRIVLVTPENLDSYILPEHPLHEAYPYLSETHKADYLRTYFMHFYGGGYCDIKKTTGSWKKSFIDFNKSNYWICGYPVKPWDADEHYLDKISDLIGTSAFICKPQTQLTTEWYNDMLQFLDMKLSELKRHPAKRTRDKKGSDSSYPIMWSEMLGKIYHKLIYKYKEYVINILPEPIFVNYK
jgi:hypothetical protein